MRVLITNDDGVASEGLWALAKRVVDAGYEAVVAAPTTDM
ncbi:MAG: 5'/3'-nucleotidase SurE, partial [Acidimicrobiaceae bacterium]|nr:5'/3'-nucleotidase SurE [Acidimicrobiaceae bacterium]